MLINDDTPTQHAPLPPRKHQTPNTKHQTQPQKKVGLVTKISQRLLLEPGSKESPTGTNSTEPWVKVVEAIQPYAATRPTELTLTLGEKCNLLCDEDRDLWLVSRRAKSNAIDSVVRL